MINKTIREFDEEERKRSLERDKINGWKKCVSCGVPSKNDFCEFCLREE